MATKERLVAAKNLVADGAPAVVWSYEWDSVRNRFRTDRPEIQVTGVLREQVLALVPACDRIYHDGRLGVQMHGKWYTVEVDGENKDLQSRVYRKIKS